LATAKEIVGNQGLSGKEMGQIILKDVARVLEQDGICGSPIIAFQRLSYEVRVTLHLDNPYHPLHDIVVEAARNPEQRFINPPLNNPSEESYLSVIERQREITSANAARVENGLPIEFYHTGTDGKLVKESVVYPPDTLPEGASPEPIDIDLTRIAKQAWADKEVDNA
jgi:hypothetical protein